MSEDSRYQVEERRGVLGWVLRRPKTTIALILLLMLVLTVLALQRNAENALARRIAAIRAKGEPVSVADLLARQRHIPDEENMLMALVKVSQAMTPVNLPKELEDRLPFLGKDYLPPTGLRWSEIEVRAARTYLDQHSQEMSSLRRALTLKRSNYNVGWITPAINFSMPELHWIRQSSQVIVLDALTAAQDEGRDTGECRTVEMLSLMRETEGCDALLGALTQLAVSALVLDGIERAINFGKLSDATLGRMNETLFAVESCPDFKAAFQAERVLFLDTMDNLRKGKLNPGWVAGGGASSISSAWRYLPAVPAIDTAAGFDLYTAIVDALDRADIAAIKRSQMAEAKLGSMNWYCFFTRTMVPALSRCVELWVRNIATNRALRAAIAAERYRLGKGSWPSSLDATVPAYLDAVPIDPMDGKQIRYAIIPEGIKTWTIAGEGHDEDNGGDVQRIEGKHHRGKDMGWVILNPELRGRAAVEGKKSAATTKAAKD